MEWQPRRLQKWLNARMELSAEFHITPVRGGLSNDNFAIDCGSDRWLLRKAPALLAHHAAHNVLREFRILQALENSPVRAPKTVISCDDRNVIGTPFYIMERVDGVVLEGHLPELYALATDSYDIVAAEMIDALVEIHRLDWHQLGLATIGQPEAFLERQVDRWLTQYHSQKVRILPHLDELAVWLRENRPAEQPVVVMHGDYQLGNMLFSRQLPARALAVIDWELTTLGDPLLDLASALISWPRVATTGPSIETIAQRYADASGRDVSNLNYYLVLAAWKRAIILESRFSSMPAAVTAESVNATTNAAQQEARLHLEQFIPSLLQQALRRSTRG